MKLATLKDLVLTKPQEIWLNYVYKKGNKLAEVEVFKVLAKELPDNFEVFKDLKQLWQHDHLTIFGIYKVNPKDKILLLLDKMLIALRDEFSTEEGRTAVSMSDFSRVCGMPLEDIKNIFNGTYLYDFWIDSNSGYERLDQNPQTLELEFRIADYRALKRILQYKDLDTQIELRWEKESQRTGGFPSSNGIFDEVKKPSDLMIENEIEIPTSEIEVKEDQNPKVFVSYSHDSKEHKRWVIDFSKKLLGSGIDVALDAWDLRHGDDVARYMETSVREADRVLMICTENYVRKANEGIGGAGYEAMIITGELIKQQGMAKFISVIKQQGDPIQLTFWPSNKMYANLSNPTTEDEEFEKLLRSLHDLSPEKKPPLGKNPFSTDLKVEPQNRVTPGQEITKAPINAAKNIEEISYYKKSLHLAQSGDSAAWRSLVIETKKKSEIELNSWKSTFKPNSFSQFDVFQGLEIYQNLFAVILGGLDSEKDKFRKQTGLLSDLAHPIGWPQSGLVSLIDFPKVIIFAYQSLYGARCLATQQFDNAIELANAKIDDPRYPQRFDKPIFLRRDLMGSIESLRGMSFLSFFERLADSNPSIFEIFGGKSEWLSSLAAYYILMSMLEVVEFTKTSPLADKKGVYTEVPIDFLLLDPDILRKAVALLADEKDQLQEILDKRKIDVGMLQEAWPMWCENFYAILRDSDQFHRDRPRVGLERIFK
jgi:hypothetical protein